MAPVLVRLWGWSQLSYGGGPDEVIPIIALALNLNRTAKPLRSTVLGPKGLRQESVEPKGYDSPELQPETMQLWTRMGTRFHMQS